MTLKDKVLADLAVSQSTLDAIAGRLKKTQLGVEKSLQKLMDENKVIPVKIMGGALTVYRVVRSAQDNKQQATNNQ